jgi:hypothetical protein
MKYRKCPKCGAPIIFIEMPGGEKMPCNPESVAYKAHKKAKGRIVTPNGEVWSCVLDVPPEEMTGIGFIPHWTTCPNANKSKS